MALALAASHLLVSAVLTLSHSVVSDSLWPIDCRPPGSSVHGVFQERILEWLAISFSRGSSQLRDWTCISCIDRWILHHWATWEASLCCSMKQIIYKYVCVCVCVYISPWGRGWEGDSQILTHVIDEILRFSYIVIGEGNGNPLRYSCLENRRDSPNIVCGITKESDTT